MRMDTPIGDKVFMVHSVPGDREGWSDTIQFNIYHNSLKIESPKWGNIPT